MKDHALEIAGKKEDRRDKLNVLREYVQAYILKILRDKGAFRSYAFLGGTALRFLYDLPRFSEDLDLSLCRGEAQPFNELMKDIKKELELSGYAVTVKARELKTVQAAMFRFEGLLYEAGLAPRREQKFSVKVEVDTHPPAGAVTEERLVNKYFPVVFLSYDLPSLFSGKCHAVLSRRYTKGRDLFDMGWYLSRFKGMAPNLPMLHNALDQTGWEGPRPSADNWREILAAAVTAMDWERVTQDVEVFLQDPADREVFTKENVLRLLK